MGRLSNKVDYENLRQSRILENQARLASLGLHQTISDLRSLSSLSSQKPQRRKWIKKVYQGAVLRRSDRLRPVTVDSTPKPLALRRSKRLNPKSDGPITPFKEEVKFEDESEDDEENRPANAPMVKMKKESIELLQLSPEASARRCSSKGRGSIYHSLLGICCHFCRQKKLCGEEECKRCSNLDPDLPCIGKTDCSVCHSSNGVYCRACLKVRYGEELEEVMTNKEWMCPHCIEEKGLRPYWICNSSLCLKKRKMVPTGIAIYRAREMGYKSVAHLVMEELQNKAKKA